jgi:hypothetical protein
MADRWKRIPAQAELLAPIHRRLSIDSMGWVGSSPAGGAEADVMPLNLNQFDQEIKDTSK